MITRVGDSKNHIMLIASKPLSYLFLYGCLHFYYILRIGHVTCITHHSKLNLNGDRLTCNSKKVRILEIKIQDIISVNFSRAAIP